MRFFFADMHPRKKRRLDVPLPAPSLVQNLTVIIPKTEHFGEPVDEPYGPEINGIKIGPTTVWKELQLRDVDEGRMHVRRLQAVDQLSKSLPRELERGVPQVRFITLSTTFAYAQERIRGATPVPKWSMHASEASRVYDTAKLILQHAHRFGIKHRDINPWNVLVSQHGVHLVDWDHHDRAQGSLQWAVDAGVDPILVDEIAQLDADSTRADFARLDALKVWITRRPVPSYIG